MPLTSLMETPGATRSSALAASNCFVSAIFLRGDQLHRGGRGDQRRGGLDGLRGSGDRVRPPRASEP